MPGDADHLLVVPWRFTLRVCLSTMSETEQTEQPSVNDDGIDTEDAKTRLRELGATLFFGLVALGASMYSTSKRGAKKTHGFTAGIVTAIGGGIIAYAAPIAAAVVIGTALAAVGAATAYFLRG